MLKKGAMLAALALSAAPQGEAFSHPNAAVLRGPALRSTSAAASCPSTSRSVRTSALPLHMSDLSDMTIEMLKRVEKDLKSLDDISLARVGVPETARRRGAPPVPASSRWCTFASARCALTFVLLTCSFLRGQLQGVCQQIADKVDIQRGPNAVGPPKKVDYSNKSFGEIEAENDAYFGLDTPLDDALEMPEVPPPPRAAYAPATAAVPAAAPAPAPTPKPSYMPAATTKAAPAAQPSWPSPAPNRVQNSQNQPAPIVEDPEGRKFSKYLPPQKVKDVKNKATIGLFRCPLTQYLCASPARHSCL